MAARVCMARGAAPLLSTYSGTPPDPVTPEQLRYLFDPAELAKVESATQPPPLLVTRYDAGRYLVRSEAREDQWYLVDLDDPAFPRGICDCDDASYRITPKIIRGQRPIRGRCKHCRAAAAELAHGENLCEAAGIEFSPRIIPTLAQWKAGL